jgi:N-methylhydantoinase A
VVRSVRVQTLGRTAPLELGESPPADAPLERALRARRPAFFAGRFEDTPVYDGERIAVGHVIRGPAIIEERFTTIVIQPGHRAALDRFGNYEITLP